MNLELPIYYVGGISSHMQLHVCHLGSGESIHNGMTSVFCAKCSGCQTNIEFSTSRKHKVTTLGMTVMSIRMSLDTIFKAR
jgi:hypothetical protein